VDPVVASGDVTYTTLPSLPGPTQRIHRLRLRLVLDIVLLDLRAAPEIGQCPRRPVIGSQAVNPPQVLDVVGSDRCFDGYRMGENHQIDRGQQCAALLEIKTNLGAVLRRLLRPIQHREVRNKFVRNGLVLLFLRSGRGLHAVSSSASVMTDMTCCRIGTGCTLASSAGDGLRIRMMQVSVFNMYSAGIKTSAPDLASSRRRP
jgi:hypothetical protein